jgi:hypothetical protein
VKDRWVDRWKGRSVVCIASGPSLVVEDCDAVRAAGHPTIVTNTTFKLAPWADVLVAFDGKWWAEYHGEVARIFKGEKLSCSPNATKYGAPDLSTQGWFRRFNNSGAASISLAIAAGAARVVLLGYDCQKGADGRTHWHGDHPRSLSNARSMPNWQLHFKNVARFAKEMSVPVINASRATALAHFERMPLAEALATKEIAA